ncbi:MAG TPA: hypothetical protein VFZ09_34565 [Archangium sp.]|uniref:hypothetical protein n=1 Tax=Archangium sp. TaxID=1872627 RepID=UPI002E363666|nr:hypothetical protein [Archangium sp.]HEX5751398.1 hypothetical protein [Archangium sp.]
MKSKSLKTMLGVLAVVAAPAALAGLSMTQPMFESRMSTARSATSPEGAVVNRSEIRGALGSFLYDDSLVDSGERAYLAPKVNDATFLTGFTTDARSYFSSFYELNDAATSSAPLSVYPVDETPAQAFGVSGVLSNSAAIQEGFIPSNQGVANQYTLQWTYYSSFDITNVGTFDPKSEAELRSELALPGATQAEIDGAVAYINQIAGNSKRIYIASWKNEYGRGAPGDLGGFVVAAVSTDRRFVRYVEFQTWSE